MHDYDFMINNVNLLSIDSSTTDYQLDCLPRIICWNFCCRLFVGSSAVDYLVDILLGISVDSFAANYLLDILHRLLVGKTAADYLMDILLQIIC